LNALREVDLQQGMTEDDNNNFLMYLHLKVAEEPLPITFRFEDSNDFEKWKVVLGAHGVEFTAGISQTRNILDSFKGKRGRANSTITLR